MFFGLSGWEKYGYASTSCSKVKLPPEASTSDWPIGLNVTAESAFAAATRPAHAVLSKVFVPMVTGSG